MPLNSGSEASAIPQIPCGSLESWQGKQYLVGKVGQHDNAWHSSNDITFRYPDGKCTCCTIAIERMNFIMNRFVEKSTTYGECPLWTIVESSPASPAIESIRVGTKLQLI